MSDLTSQLDYFQNQIDELNNVINETRAKQSVSEAMIAKDEEAIADYETKLDSLIGTHDPASVEKYLNDKRTELGNLMSDMTGLTDHINDSSYEFTQDDINVLENIIAKYNLGGQ